MYLFLIQQHRNIKNINDNVKKECCKKCSGNDTILNATTRLMRFKIMSIAQIDGKHII